MDRGWQERNPDAEVIRDEPGTQNLQTVEPFSSRADAIKAEAIAIHIAMLSGVAVYQAEGEVWVGDGQVRVANSAGVDSTTVLGPAVRRRTGTVSFSSLTETAIVKIAAQERDDRPGPYGGIEGAVFSRRAQKWWTVAADKQSRVERLIAILAGSNGVILGDWDSIHISATVPAIACSH